MGNGRRDGMVLTKWSNFFGRPGKERLGNGPELPAQL